MGSTSEIKSKAQRKVETPLVEDTNIHKIKQICWLQDGLVTFEALHHPVTERAAYEGNRGDRVAHGVKKISPASSESYWRSTRGTCNCLAK